MKKIPKSRITGLTVKEVVSVLSTQREDARVFIGCDQDEQLQGEDAWAIVDVDGDIFILSYEPEKTFTDLTPPSTGGQS